MNQFINLFAEYGLFLGIPLAFLLLVAWIYRSSAKKRYQADGNIPFHGNEKGGKTPQSGD